MTSGMECIAMTIVHESYDHDVTILVQCSICVLIFLDFVWHEDICVLRSDN